MAKVELLDCTLRDGGHVIDWKFGQERIRKIIQNLSDAKLDYVEIGFLRDIDYDPDRSLFSKVEQSNDLLESLENDTNISLMVRPDWIDLQKLPQATQVNSIRFAFYERDLQLVLKQAKIAAGAGYKVFVNPINILSYTPKSLESLLIKINDLDPMGVSVVDTFGALMPQDLKNIVPIFENTLKPSIKLGVHLHENLSLSFALAMIFIDEVSANRDIIIDSSILGMGRAPGNLPTELITPLLNQHHSKKIDMQSILECAENEIQPIKKSFKWGYSAEYAVSAALKVHRSYAEYLFDEVGCTLSQMENIMKKIYQMGEHNTFNQNLADQIKGEIL